MIKPLFAKRRPKTFPLTVTRQEQPLLFAFVERLCEMVGAPKPKRIDVDTAVNASAGFSGGVIALLRRDLVLTIGLPLAAGLNLCEFTAILAHEFGHLAQGTGMRLSYLIRSLNAWFFRVVYERDAWDHWLIASSRRSSHWFLHLVVALARACIWFTRKILWLLMMTGHAISAFMLRQMEFDADRYGARVVGGDVFEQASRRVMLLDLAAKAAFAELSTSWRDRRLCDDLPALVCTREAALPPAIREGFLAAAFGFKTRWFATHPATADRVAAARYDSPTGVFKTAGPATALLNDYPDLARRATAAFYMRALGAAVSHKNLVATETIVANTAQKRDNFQALRRFFQNLVHPMCPVFPDRTEAVPTDADQAAEVLLALRSKLLASADKARQAMKMLQESDERIAALWRLRALQSAQQRVDLKELKLDTADEAKLSETETSIAARKLAAEAAAKEVLASAMTRLHIALWLEKKPRPEPRAPASEADDYGEYDLADDSATTDDAEIDALQALRLSWDAVERLRQRVVVLKQLLARCKRDGNPRPLVLDLLTSAKIAHAELSQLHATLRGTTYPYDHSHGKISLARYAIPALPQPQEVGKIFAAAEGALKAIFSLYLRAMSGLALRAEQIENGLGLPPLAEAEDASPPNAA